MANCKHVFIRGNAPFNLYQHEPIQPHLAFMAGPNTGLEMVWAGQSAKSEPNEYGGTTAYYDFCIRGVESVSWGWLTGLTDGIRAVGGEIYIDETRDIE